MIHIIFLLYCAIFGEVIGHHQTYFETSNEEKTISNINKNCCVSGRYDIENKKCVGENEKVYPFSMICREFVPLSNIEYGEDFIVDAENACFADIYSKNKQKSKQEYFFCNEFESCCISGQFNPNTSTCIGTTTAKYTFSLYCQKIIPDESFVAKIASFVSEDRICVEKIQEYDESPSEAYLTCEKINMELALTFETWLYPISVAFLILTLWIYLTELKQLRSPQDISFMIAITCLMLHMILNLARYVNSSAWITLVYNYAGRYLKTAYFSWFNVMLISRLIENRNLAKNYPFDCTIRPIWNHLYAWTVPVFFIVLYYYYPRLNWHVPILILWIVNLILLIAVIITVEYDKNTKYLIWQRNYYRSWLLVRLFLGAGVLWVFGASYRVPIFTSLFALQGILIFLVMVVYRYSAKRKLGGVKFGCITFPKRWKNVPKIDEDDVPADSIYQSDLGEDNFFIGIGVDEP